MNAQDRHRSQQALAIRYTLNGIVAAAPADCASLMAAATIASLESNWTGVVELLRAAIKGKPAGTWTNRAYFLANELAKKVAQDAATPVLVVRDDFTILNN